MRNRKALQDAVIGSYPNIPIYEIEKMELEKLQWLFDATEGKYKTPYVKPNKHKSKKIFADYQLRNGELVWVEKWRATDTLGINATTDKEYVQAVNNRVVFQGKQMSASILKHYLMTGEWVKRVPKPSKPFKAVVYSNGKALHLGYFATEEERKDAIFLYKMGIFNKKV